MIDKAHTMSAMIAEVADVIDVTPHEFLTALTMSTAIVLSVADEPREAIGFYKEALELALGEILVAEEAAA